MTMTKHEIEKIERAEVREDVRTCLRLAADMIGDITVTTRKDVNGKKYHLAEVGVYRPSNIDMLNIHHEFTNWVGHKNVCWDEIGESIVWGLRVEHDLTDVLTDDSKRKLREFGF